MATSDVWQILVIDDDAETCAQLKEFFEKEKIYKEDPPPTVITSVNFDEALSILEAQRIDLVILDIRQDVKGTTSNDQAGIKIVEAIKIRRFVPIIFYTGLPASAEGLLSPFVRVLEKSQGVSKLLDEVRNLFSTDLPLINRALYKHLEKIQRDYMWGYVASNWNEIGKSPDKFSTAYLLARRLAKSLSDERIREFALEIGMQGEAKIEAGQAHGMQYYVIPPIVDSPFAGDVYRGKVNDVESYWVLLTPTCDMVAGREKAEYVLLAKCQQLEGEKEYAAWQKDKERNKNGLKELLTNKRQRDRYFFLPRALSIPNLLVDFQNLKTMPIGDLKTLERIASLDSPFGESLTARYGRYIGRLGVPDLDIDGIIASFEP